MILLIHNQCLEHLTEGDSQFWNQQLSAIPEGKSLRNHDPHELVLLGLYALHVITGEFKRQIQDR